ncbi:hypothetical protein [Neorhizobium petrolearium]|uniref:Uncharacterized protein n=1 Tax=Neorhizobium petrolearium TaxID=515361 RepID=A0ABY8M454_9HYPH|nr:hypothetical protein [Neorhizobium petrolearium]MCC2609097.1 hypothetical protein [Neorhizobium petrolearium]WGI69328.1 hypothetical protein QEO92_04390 [Neorhizobium petrolearium]
MAGNGDTRRSDVGLKFARIGIGSRRDQSRSNCLFFSSCRKAPARAAIAVLLLFGLPPASFAETVIDPDGPFRMGEGYADRPATCETVKHWIDHAPPTDDRITLTISGRLVAVDWDGTLAYLVMCDEKDVQVMCITYSKEGRNIGDPVLFAGGYARFGARRIMLDPCLASPEE